MLKKYNYLIYLTLNTKLLLRDVVITYKFSIKYNKKTQTNICIIVVITYKFSIKYNYYDNHGTHHRVVITYKFSIKYNCLNTPTDLFVL